jgi:tetratricopeptide (TPR) repeat protein
VAGDGGTRRRVAVLLLAAASLLPFANGIASDFTYDDKAIVRDNARLRSPATFGQLFETSYFGGPRGSGSAYRPFLVASFAVEWWVHGGRAAAFRAVNVALHLGVTLLVWSLLRRLALSEAAALAAALLFAAHPLHVEAVTSLVGRGELLAAIFSLAYLHAALRRRDGRRRTILSLGAAGAAYLAALLTKESAATAPLLAGLCFFRLGSGGPWRRLRDALRSDVPLWVVSGAALAADLAVRAWILGGLLRAPGTGVFEVENPLASLPPFARAGNAAAILLRYVGRFLLPWRLSADESAFAIRPAPAVSFLALGALLLLLVAAAAAFARPGAPAGFGLLFFLAAILPGSNLIFATGTIFAERLVYLPSAGLCLALAAAIVPRATPERLAPSRTAVLAAAILVFASRAAVRNLAWWSDETLFENCAALSPGSAKNQYNLGYIRAEKRRFAEGASAYARAVAIYPRYWDAWAGKGKCERELGRLADARKSYERSLAVLPTYENGFFGLGLVLEDLGKTEEALGVYRRGLAKNPESLPLAFRAAAMATAAGDRDAEALWRSAVAAHPGALPPRFGLARFLAAAGRAAESRRELRRILKAAPYDAPALRFLADLQAREGQHLAAALAREKAFRGTRFRGDLERLEAAARDSPAYRRRFGTLRPYLERLAPWAF